MLNSCISSFIAALHKAYAYAKISGEYINKFILPVDLYDPVHPAKANTSVKSYCQ